LPKTSSSDAKRNSKKKPLKRVARTTSQRVSSEDAIKAGEQIAMAALASGLKLAAALGTVAAKTAGLAFTSVATGADKFSKMIQEEMSTPVKSNALKRRSRSRSPRGNSS
jgi:hypothetical protein